MNTDSIKGQVRCTQTLTVQMEGPSLTLQIQQYRWKGLHSKRRSSPCIFQVVVSLSIRAFVHTYPQNI
jgi:hypothetical protein